MATNSRILAARAPILRPNLSNGYPIQNTGSGDDEYIILRTATEGVVTVGTFVALTGTPANNIVNGLINVEGCTSITLFVSIVKGSLTGLQFNAFSIEGGFTFEHSSYEWDATNNKYVAFNTLIERTLAADADFMIHVPLFNLKNVGFRVNGIGTATNSELIVLAKRGWSPSPLFRA